MPRRLSIVLNSLALIYLSVSCTGNIIITKDIEYLADCIDLRCVYFDFLNGRGEIWETELNLNYEDVL